ncbi:MAG: co-chaperone GroES [Armatimonadota bacterium]|jgi:chaperonin GroES|nr:co-chaperone GroES [Armatimonadota bacterium]
MLKPIADKVIVKAKAEEEKTSGGIILPDTAKEKPQEGTVIAVGPGRTLDNGQKKPMSVKEGDTVIYSKYGGTNVTLGGEEYLILDEDSIYAIVE